MADSPSQQSTAAIFEQIEAAADYYPPGSYAGLLDFYSNFFITPDSLGYQYIALSAVDARARNPKKFVIGVLPPAVTRPGKLLDRSAIQGVQIPSDAASEERLRAIGAEEVSTVQQIENKQPPIPSRLQGVSSRNIQTLRPEIQPLAQELIRRCAQEGIPLVVTVGSRTKEEQDKLYEQGRTPGNNKPLATGAKGGESRHNYGVAFDTAIIINGKESQSRALWDRVGAIGESIGLEWGAHIITPPPEDFGHFQYDGGLNLEQLKAGVALPPPPSVGNSVNSDSLESSDWQKEGSQASSASRQQQAKLANTQITGVTDLGKQLQDAQRAQIAEMQAALDKLQSVPPLQMLINPKSFTVRGEKITQDGNWGRNGPIIEHWGDNQDKISGSGSVAGFYALAGALTGPGQDSVVGSKGPGLTRMARNFSLSYQNFLSLYLLYRNNAGLYMLDPSQKNRLTLVLAGSIYIYYDNILYLGSFDTFNITEDDSRPFTLDYSFEFTVRASFLLDRPNDQGFTYGFPAVQSPGTTRGLPTTTPPQPSPIPGLTNQDIADFVANDPSTTVVPGVS
jgi:hypothetical protein